MTDNASALSMLFRRSAAFLYDCLLLIALFFIITAIAIGFNDGEAIRHPLWYGVLYLIGFVFFDGFWRHGGQTLGMRAWRIRLCDTDGGTPTRSQNLLRYVSGTALFGFTLLFLPFSGDASAIHDRISKTKIVRHNK